MLFPQLSRNKLFYVIERNDKYLKIILQPFDLYKCSVKHCFLSRLCLQLHTLLIKNWMFASPIVLHSIHKGINSPQECAGMSFRPLVT